MEEHFLLARLQHKDEKALAQLIDQYAGYVLATVRAAGAGVLAEADLQRLWCRRPAEIFRLPWNGFAPGDPADFFLLDPDEVWTPGPETMYSKSRNTPFLGRSLHGRVKHHWLGGQRLF